MVEKYYTRTSKTAKPKPVLCWHCHEVKHRRVRGGSSDAGRFCSRECAFARLAIVKAERAGIKRIHARCSTKYEYKTKIQSRVSEEVQALLRIARYNERIRRAACVCCGSQVRTLGKGRTRIVCEACRDERRKQVAKAWRKTETGRSAKRAAKSRRRALERGTALADRIDPIAVFERDKWRCHLCGRKTNKKLRGTYEDDAPELDHIVTLADGGSHTLGNLACSCRRCNGTKGAASRGQVLFSF